MATFDEFIQQMKNSSRNMTHLEMHMLYLKQKSNEREQKKRKQPDSNKKPPSQSTSGSSNRSFNSTQPSQFTTASSNQASSSSSEGLDVHMKKLNALRTIHKQSKSISSDSGLIESQVDGETMLFQNVSNDGSGHCLFYSLLHLMQRQGRLQGYTVNDIRREIADLLLKLKDSEVSEITWEQFVFFVADNQYDVDNIDDNSFQHWKRNGGFEEYVQNLRTTNQWGRDIEIVAAGLLYEVNIFVYVLNNLKAGPIKAIEVPGGTTLNLLYRGGVHYEALIPLGL
jgi:hypothetical protein